jgi:hypothetical protein
MPLSDSAGKIEYLKISQINTSLSIKSESKNRTVFPVQKSTCAVLADPSEHMHNLGMLSAGQTSFHRQRQTDRADS